VSKTASDNPFRVPVPRPAAAPASPQPAADVPEDSTDIADILASGFGDSVTFEEVEE